MVLFEEISNTKKKRKKECNRKLLVGVNVEVRNVDKEMAGSWKSGIVTGEDKLMRCVQLDNVYLKYSSSNNLIREVPVSTMIEGEIPAFGMPKTYRGLIRPMPPVLDFFHSNLNYGLCVDVKFEDSWLEGVIFDYRDDSLEERLIYFPDSDMERRVGHENVRITQDWDEINGHWSPRGYWLFLQLIEQHVGDTPVDYSVRQLWCILRKTDVFRNRITNWTSSSGSMWDSVIIEVISDITDHVPSMNCSCKSEGLGSVNLPAEVEDTDNSIRKLRKTSSSIEVLSENQLEVYIPQQPILQNEGDPSCADLGNCVATDDTMFFDDFLTEDDLCIDNLLMNSFDPNDATLKDLVSGDPCSSSSEHDVDFGRNNEFVAGDEFCGDLPCSNSELINCIDFNDDIQKWDEETHEEPEPTYVTHGQNGRDAKSLVPTGSNILAKADQCQKVGESSSSSSCSDSRALVLHEKELDLEVNIKPMYCPQAIIDWCHYLASEFKQQVSQRSLSLKAKQHLVAVGWKLKYIRKQVTRRELRYYSPRGKIHITLLSACEEVMKYTLSTEELKPKSSYEIICTGGEERCLVKKRKSAAPTTADLHGKKRRWSWDPNQEGKKRKLPGSHSKEGERDGIHQNLVPASSKRVQHNVVSSPMDHNPRTLLSCLIDGNVILPRAKVYCMDSKCKVGEGQITRKGIKCSCCQKVFDLASFEAHAGSISCQPTANIYLDDGTGRSLLQCQKQLIQDRKLKSSSSKPRERLKRSIPPSKNDFICSVCRYGGQLVMCDHCPSSFHLSCLGMKDSDLPEGSWFCPSCKCCICEQRELNGDIEKFTAKTLLSCHQCELEYHVGCVKQRELVNLESRPAGNWFCSANCEKIFAGLQECLGKSYAVGVKNLSYTVLKSHRNDLNASETDTMVEHQSKLYVALGVMHECFDPIKAPRSKRDLIEDVLFNNWSELNRLNFRGFYTIVLQREDEMISVATFRVHGAKVAEIPLVGTCVQHRGQGMGSILMDVLGKKLAELGVERLVLPAVAKVVQTWTKAFGFSEMTQSERLELLHYTFLDFQDTKMCQKILKSMPPPTDTPAKNI